MSSVCTHPWTLMEGTYYLSTVSGVGGASKKGPCLDHQRQQQPPQGLRYEKALLQGRALNTPPKGYMPWHPVHYHSHTCPCYRVTGPMGCAHGGRRVPQWCKVTIPSADAQAS